MWDDSEIVLACTDCKIVYFVQILDREGDGVGDAPVAAFCPYCGKKLTVTDALIPPEFERKFNLIRGGKE
jgi:hypothetical protein